VVRTECVGRRNRIARIQVDEADGHRPHPSLEVMVKFSGKLQIEADPRNWLKTDLTLTQGRLELVSGGDLLGSWSTAQVKAERVEGDRFQLHLGDDRAVFAADDALAFSYEALPVLAKKTVLATATGLRGKLRKGLAGAERPAPPDTHDTIEPAPSAVPDPEPEEEQAESPQPPRKLRDLIQAAVRSNMGETPTPEESNWWAPESGPRAGHPEQQLPAIEPPPEPEYSDPVWSEPDAVSAVPEPEPKPEVIAEPDPDPEEPPPPDLPEIGSDEAQLERPTFDLSPIFAEPAASYETIEGPRPSRGLLDVVTTGFENGETLGERPAEPFGWIRAAEEAMPLVEPPTQVVRSLDTLIEEVRNGGMSPAQVGAVTDLIRAVAEAVSDKNHR
jgi:hypothetical protein